MSFASPIWLALLLPWAGFTVWLLWMRYSGTRVPFLELWRGPIEPSRATRRFHLPPVALMAFIIAMLLAIFAAARPAWRRHIAASSPSTAPAKPQANIGITHVAAIERPRAQVMVTVRNDSADIQSASLEVRSGERSARREIALPPPGREANFFVDLPALADAVDVVLHVVDDVEADNAAKLVRRAAPPSVEVRGDVAPEVRRVAEAYARARPAGEHGRVVAIPPAAGEGGVIVTSGDVAEPTTGVAQVVVHPVTANVDFAKLPSVSTTTNPPAGGGWTAVVTVAGKPIVAVREAPARQVWIGFEAADFARTPAFVVLWTNVIDWVGGGGETQFVATDVPRPTDNAAKPQAAEEPGAAEMSDLTPWLALAALFCVFFAVLAWPRGRRLTAFSAPRTV